MHNIVREELAWAAGFYEGEGHIRSRFSERFNGIEMNVANTNKEPLERFRDALGFGSIRLDHKATTKRSALYVWHASRFELAQAAVAMLWPWLSARRRAQAKTALVACRDRWTTGHRGRRGQVATCI